MYGMESLILEKRVLRIIFGALFIIWVWRNRYNRELEKWYNDAPIVIKIQTAQYLQENVTLPNNKEADENIDFWKLTKVYPPPLGDLPTIEQ